MNTKAVVIKFVGALLASWSIMSVLTKITDQISANANNATGWVQFSFPSTEALALAIGLTLLLANFEK